ncbi:hypothetical protein ACFL1Q_00570 [Patescibacteria group bacterium]
MKKTYLFLAILIGAHLFLLLNLRFTPWPEMLSYPYLFSKGYVLYKDFVVPYPPFLVLLLSCVYKLFGYQIIVLKVFTWILILLSDIIIYKITKIITKKDLFSLLAVSFFVLTQPFLEGNMLWFDTFLVLPVLLGVYFLLKKGFVINLFLAGIFLTISLFSKQTAIFYVLIASILVFLRNKKLKEVIILLTPSIIFGLLLLGYLLQTGSVDVFINWNLIYPFTYWGKYPSYLQLQLGRVDWLILAGLAAPAIVMFRKYKLVFWIFLGSLLAVYPRFSYYHLAVGIALWSICVGVLLNNYSKKRLIMMAVLIFLLFFYWFRVRTILDWDWRVDDRFYDPSDIQIAKDINSSKEQKGSIYLANIHSGVYAYAQVLPPKPWYDNYGWYLEIPGQQEKVTKSWEGNPPEEIYWKDELKGEWYLPGVYRPKDIYYWVRENYTKEKEVTNGVWLWKKK